MIIGNTQNESGRVAVYLKKQLEFPNSHYFQVQVRSKVKPEIWAHNEVYLYESNIPYRMQLAAAACAEHLEEQYGDSFDIDSIVKEALSNFEVLVEAINSPDSGVEKIG